MSDHVGEEHLVALMAAILIARHDYPHAMDGQKAARELRFACAAEDARGLLIAAKKVTGMYNEDVDGPA